MGLLTSYTALQQKGAEFEEEQQGRRKDKYKSDLTAKMREGTVTPEQALSPAASDGNLAPQPDATFFDHFKDFLLPGQPFTGELGNMADVNSEAATEYYQNEAGRKMARVRNMDAQEQLEIKETIARILQSHPDDYRNFEPRTPVEQKAMVYLLGVASDFKEVQIRSMKNAQEEAKQKWPDFAAKRILAQDYYRKGDYTNAGNNYVEMIRESKQGYRDAEYVPEKNGQGHIQFTIDGNDEVQKVPLEEVGNFIQKVTSDTFPKYEAAAIRGRQQQNFESLNNMRWFTKGDSKVMGNKMLKANSATGVDDEIWTFWKQGEDGVLKDKDGQAVRSLAGLVNQGYGEVKDEKAIADLDYKRKLAEGKIKNTPADKFTYTKKKDRVNFVEKAIGDMKIKLQASGELPMSSEDEAYNRERVGKSWDMQTGGAAIQEKSKEGASTPEDLKEKAHQEKVAKMKAATERSRSLAQGRAQKKQDRHSRMNAALNDNTSPSRRSAIVEDLLDPNSF